MSNPFTELVGNSILSHTGSYDVSELQKKNGVLLYFSAHWCPPCRGFTPELAKYYTSHKDKFNFEIIFVSSDKDESSFNEYWKEMPWLALPFQNRDLKNTLSKKYKVRGIPTLVVLDNKGQTVTTDGRSKVSSSPEEFPWTPKSFSQILENGHLIDGKGNNVEPSSLKSKKALGIYFSAHWCGPCRTTTPKIVQTYETLKKAGKDFEIIFATSDKDEASFKSYFGEMPWLAFPFGDKRIGEFSDLYGVEGIPTFVIVDPATGKTITSEGRSAIEADPEGHAFPWHPKPLNSIEQAGGSLNEDVCFVYLDSNLSDAAKAELQKVAESNWNQWNASGQDHPVKFFFGKSGGIVDRIRTFVKVEEDPVIIILNLSEGETYKVPGTASEQFFQDTIKKFISKQLTPTKLS